MTRKSGKRGSTRGFTLVEMAVALSIIGIAIAIAVPSFRGSFNRANVDRAEAEIQSDLKLAISTAKATGRAVRLDFNSNGYRLIDANDTSRVIREKSFGNHVSISSTGDPLVFPWGLVQTADIQITGADNYSSLQILPTGRLQHPEQD